MVSAAQRVQRLDELTVPRPPVVDRDAAEAAQHAGVEHRLHAALAMHAQQCQRLGRSRVDPAQAAIDPPTGLIEMRRLRAGELGANLRKELADRRAHARREARACQLPALTPALLDPVLNTVKPRHLRQVEHLPRLRLHDRHPRHVAPAALAHLHRMQNCPEACHTRPTTAAWKSCASSDQAAHEAPRRAPQAQRSA
jgi:hypothetical protein